MAFRLARALRSAARVVPRVRVVHEPWSQLNVLAAAGIVLGSSVAACKEKKKIQIKEEKKEEKKQLAPGFKEGEPVIKFADVKQHNCIEKGIWVTYRDGVYDITKFVQNHPGGLERILKAASGQIDPFWAMYAQHNVASVKEILGEHRIGHLSEDEYKNLPPPFDPYQTDPKRDPALVIQAAKPFNAECPLSQLEKQEYLTPNPKFFVRNHLPVPTGDLVDPKKYALEIVPGEDEKPVRLTMADLQDEKRFKRRKVCAIVQCSGNRREDQNSVAQVEGLTWYTGAISCAEWEGVALRDVLEYVGVPSDLGMKSELEGEDEQLHLQMEGMDRPKVGEWRDTKGFYGASIPLAWAQDPRRDVILTFKMNGEPLPADHGAPLRCLVPGVAGARSVKWLSKLIVASEESQSHWQQNDYKAFNNSITWETADFTSLPAIQDMPVNSAISAPAAKSLVQLNAEGCVEMKGWAWSGGGRGIARVEVSADGHTWTEAELQRPEGQSLTRTWAWTLWKANIPVPPELQKPGKALTLMVKAVDANYNVQPESIESVWNIRGVLCNGWHKVHVTIQPKRVGKTRLEFGYAE
ncbi:Sulfite oxidase [Durusdinium trenchii]|uniref:Mitochondrial n=1 Tax=Durusdinium trenchii TaxID=1381693 RepID=A0ABP0SRT1_9DINO